MCSDDHISNHYADNGDIPETKKTQLNTPGCATFHKID